MNIRHSISKFSLAPRTLHSPALGAELYSQLDNWIFDPDDPTAVIKIYMCDQAFNELPYVDFPTLRQAFHLEHGIHPDCKLEFFNYNAALPLFTQSGLSNPDELACKTSWKQFLDKPPVQPPIPYSPIRQWTPEDQHRRELHDNLAKEFLVHER